MTTMVKITPLEIFVVCGTVDLTIVLTTACNSCPLSWMSLGQTCVKLFFKSLTFHEAENACRGFKVNDCDGTVLSEGHLVSIHTQQEQDVLVKLVQQTLSVNQTGWDPQIYIGMSVGSTDNDQSWTDGSNVSFTSWFPGEPNFAPYSRGVIAAGPYSRGNWADVPASYRYPYFCQICCLENELSQ